MCFYCFNGTLFTIVENKKAVNDTVDMQEMLLYLSIFLGCVY